jgi:hypothetical protein
MAPTVSMGRRSRRMATPTQSQLAAPGPGQFPRPPAFLAAGLVQQFHLRPNPVALAFPPQISLLSIASSQNSHFPSPFSNSIKAFPFSPFPRRPLGPPTQPPLAVVIAADNTKCALLASMRPRSSNSTRWRRKLAVASSPLSGECESGRPGSSWPPSSSEKSANFG